MQQQLFSTRKSRLHFGHDGNALTQLIVALSVAFVLLLFVKIIYYLANLPIADYYSGIFHLFTLPANAAEFWHKPWSIFTYGMVHENPFNVISNLLWLYAFGYIFQDLAGNNKVIPVFVYGIVVGGLLYFLLFNILPVFQDLKANNYILGAGAGVMAIAVAVTTLSPDYRIFPMINGGIPIWILTAIFVLIDLATLPTANPGTHLAHLAGGVMGFVLMRQLKRGNDWTAWMNNGYEGFMNLFNPNKKSHLKVVKNELFYQQNGRKPFEKTARVSQQRVDEILDKINTKGYHFLTDDEKEILRKASE